MVELIEDVELPSTSAWTAQCVRQQPLDQEHTQWARA